MTQNNKPPNENLESPTRTKSWCWYSTLESARDLKLSVLALVETAFAIGIYVWLVLNGFTLHLIMGACVAPFLLLRTPQSVELAFSMGKPIYEITSEWFFDAIDNIRNETIQNILIVILSGPVIGLVLMGIRFTATVIAVIKAPVKSVRTMPINWWRIVGCVDSFHPPETLPGYEPKTHQDWNEAEHFLYPHEFILSTAQKQEEEEEAFLKVLVWLITPFIFSGFILFLVLPALIYRWSLKGSSLIYLPLIWIVRLTTRENVKRLLLDIRDLTFHKLRRLLGLFMIVFLISKLFVAAIWDYLSATWLKMDPYGFVAIFVAPTEIPRWQIASATNGLLVWITLFIAEFALRDQRESDVSKGYVIAIRSIWFIGSILTFYTIAILIYNAWTLQWDLVPIGEKWFPWSAQTQ